jgi:cyanophycinase
MNLLAIIGLLLTATLVPAQNAAYQYIRVGNTQDVAPKTAVGYALLGGGEDLDEAFRWLCEKGNGGDFLVVRAAGTDAYNPYVQQICKVNSVATLIIPSREAAAEPKVVEIIRQAEVVFISGGDQARYINWWMGTPVQDALNAHIAAGKPMGGTSAGLAVLGQYVYSAQGDAPDDDGLGSEAALADPYMPRVTLRRDFLEIDLLRNTLTDTHFAKRDRMGRSLAFLARIVKDGWSPGPRDIAVDEENALLLERDGKSRVIGPGKGVYFLLMRRGPDVCRAHAALSVSEIAVYKAPAGAQFNLRDWKGKGGVGYTLSVVEGKVQSTQKNGEAY